MRRNPKGGGRPTVSGKWQRGNPPYAHRRHHTTTTTATKFWTAETATGNHGTYIEGGGRPRQRSLTTVTELQQWCWTYRVERFDTSRNIGNFDTSKRRTLHPIHRYRACFPPPPYPGTTRVFYADTKTKRIHAPSGTEHRDGRARHTWCIRCMVFIPSPACR